MLTTESLERIYDELARAIDTAGPAHESLFLTKLALALANQLGDEARVREQIHLAGQHLHAPSAE